MKRASIKKPTMDAQALASRLAPFKVLSTKHALSARYKTLELEPKMVRGLSSYALLEISVNLQISQPCCVDATLFLSVLDSLPKGSPLQLTTGDGVIAWECGNAKGKLAMASLDKPLPQVKYREEEEPDQFPLYEVPDVFAKALTLGSISCIGNNTLASVGMYGVVLDNRKGLSVASSDNITISYYAVSKKSIAAPELMTLPPDGAKVLSMVLDKHKGHMEFNDNDVTFISDDAKLTVKLVQTLKVDLATVLKAHTGKEHVATISPDAIGAFIKRVGVIAETKKNAHVILSVEDTRLGLSFAEAIASSEEVYLVEGLENCPDIAGINLSAERLARALSHVSSVVLDRAADSIVMFTGGDFKYLVAGRTAQ